MDEVVPIVAIAGSFIFVFSLVKIVLDFRTRRSLIEKGLLDEKVAYLSKFTNGFMGSLKWGIVLVGIGLALVIYKAFPVYDWRRSGDEEAYVFGLMALFAGVGLLIYYFVSATQMKKQKREIEQMENKNKLQ